MLKTPERFTAATDLPSKALQPLAGNFLSVGLHALLATVAIGWFLQFFTGVLANYPGLGIALALLGVFLGLAVAGGSLFEPSSRRRHGSCALGIICALGAIWVFQVKVTYLGTTDYHTRYTLPHREWHYGNMAQEVQLTADDGIRLVGSFLAGDHDFGLVLYPSWLTGRNGFATITMARWLAVSYQVLVVSPRGVDSSNGIQRPSGEGKFDLLAAARFLRAKGAKKIGILAEGDAAIAATLAVAEQRGFDALALAGPDASWGESVPGESWVMDPRSWLGRIYWRVAAGVRLGSGISPVLIEEISRISPVPLLLLGGSQEPRDLARQIFLAAGEPRSLRLLPGSGRPCEWDAFASYYSTVRDWFYRIFNPKPLPTMPATPDMSADSSITSLSSTATAELPLRALEELIPEPTPLAPTLPPLR